MAIGHSEVDEPVAGKPETKTVVAGELVVVTVDVSDEGNVVVDSFSFDGGDVVVVGSGVLIEATQICLPVLSL